MAGAPHSQTPVVDAHHHLWDPSRRDYPWMAGLLPLQRRFDVADLGTCAAEAGVDATVLVQTVGDETETEEFLALAAAHQRIAGVVGWVDLAAPDVADRIAGLRALTGGDRLVGLRHQVHDEPDPEWLDRPDVRAGLAAVAAAGLRFDLLVRERELPAAIRTARALPQLAFVLDHAAKPPIAAGRREPWASLVADLATLDNVTVKVSGLVTEAAPGWSPADLRPYVEHVLDVFGPQRAMLGSDWPVCLLAAGSYREVVTTMRALLDRLDPGERAAVEGGTAVATYGLDLDRGRVRVP